MAISSLVVILVVQIPAIAAVEDESDSPVSIDIDSPLPLATPFESVKPEAWCIEIPSIRRDV